MNRFRPQQISLRYRLSHWRQTGIKQSWNWQSRMTRSCTATQPQVYRIGAQLHYLSDHAPNPVQQRWRRAFKLFCQRYKKF
jgi:hypothetical protein